MGNDAGMPQASSVANLADGSAPDVAFLKSVLASLTDCVKILDLEGRLAYMTENGKRAMEVSDFGGIQGCPWPDFWQGELRTKAREAIETARAGGIGHFQGAASTVAGSPRYWDVKVSAIVGADGKPTSFLSVSRDITSAKAAEDRTALLMEELSHRIKNTFALVQAITAQTLRHGNTLEDAAKALDARLLAMSVAHDALLRGSWTATPLRDLVEDVSNLHGGDANFAISGPNTVLGPKTAMSLALVLHELGTNAAKHGALSKGGQVCITWTVGDGADAMFDLHWRESGGPPVTPPQRKGFGTQLIERSISTGNGVDVALSYPTSGVEFKLHAPLNALRD